MKKLRVNQLCFNYGPQQILHNINFELPAQHTLALIGPSGCGKSTLLHLLAGLLTPTSGDYEQPFAPLSVMFQAPRLMPWKTAAANIGLGLKAWNIHKAQRVQRSMDFGELMGLSQQDLHKYPKELSGGMQSRVALARALIIQPELLLLDEPFSALDIGLKQELYQLLRAQIELQKMTVLMITHDLMEAVRLADQIYVMPPHPGQIIHEISIRHPHQLRDEQWVYQTTADLLQDEMIQQSFFNQANK